MGLMGMAAMSDSISEQLKPSFHNHKLCDQGQVIMLCFLGWFTYILSSPPQALLDALESWPTWTTTLQLPLISSKFYLWEA